MISFVWLLDDLARVLLRTMVQLEVAALANLPSVHLPVLVLAPCRLFNPAKPMVAFRTQPFGVVWLVNMLAARDLLDVLATLPFPYRPDSFLMLRFLFGRFLVLLGFF